ncbi:MAG: TRAP transporter substrate-binding protein [Smithellaceae bacterium]|nr:TRAP transporter substrate-binding protein [Smithellaceae bacterium]
MKNAFVKIFLLLTVVLFSAGLTKPTDSLGQGKMVLKAGSSTAETHPYNLGLKRFKELVEKGTAGKIEIQIFHSSALGAERELAEGMQIGSVDVVISSTGPLGGFVPKMNVVDLPFLFRDKAHAYKVLDGPIGASLLGELEKRNIIGLAFWENGFRHVTNARREIKVPADLKGLKLRTMENRVHMAAFRQLEAAPTPMAFSEVFTALQTKTLDGQENPIPVIFTSRFYEVQKFLSLSGHVYSPAPLMVSKHTWDKLTEEQKGVFKKAAIEARDYERDLITKQENEQIDKLKAAGMTVTLVDKSLFQKATLPVYSQFEAEFGKELIERIVNTK